MEFSDFSPDSSYYEEDSIEDVAVFYDHHFHDDSQAFHADQLPVSNQNEELTIDPKPIFSDNSTAVFDNLEQTRLFIHKNLGINPSNCRSCPLPGIIILPIQNFNLIRKDDRAGRNCPNILSFPTIDEYKVIHPDFTQVIQVFEQMRGPIKN